MAELDELKAHQEHVIAAVNRRDRIARFSLFGFFLEGKHVIVQPQ